MERLSSPSLRRISRVGEGKKEQAPLLGSEDRRLSFPLAAATAAIISVLIRDNIRLMFMVLMAMLVSGGLVA